MDGVNNLGTSCWLGEFGSPPPPEPGIVPMDFDLARTSDAVSTFFFLVGDVSLLGELDDWEEEDSLTSLILLMCW